MTSGPLAESERSAVLDALRGFALLGILVSHVPGFSGYEFMPAHEQRALDTFGVDRELAALSDLLVRGKFFSLFSLLFGIGFAVQLESARRRGARFARHFTRRLAVLCAIGIAHGLLWYGDMLRDYALLGLALIPAAAWSDAKLFRVTAMLFALRVAWPLLMLAGAPLIAPLAPTSAGADPRAHFFELTRAFGANDLSEIFSVNLELLRLKALQLVYEGKALSILGMFFLGAYLGKTRLPFALAENRARLARVLSVCLPLGLVGNALLVPLHGATRAYPPTLVWAAEGLLFSIAVPALTLAYASAFALAFARGSRAVHLFAPAGRTALTTYVTQTIACVAMFYGFGVGLHDDLGLAACLVTAIAIFAVQSAVAEGWLRRFQFGPLEWCWRRLTYGVPIPFARSAPLTRGDSPRCPP